MQGENNSKDGIVVGSGTARGLFANKRLSIIVAVVLVFVVAAGGFLLYRNRSRQQLQELKTKTNSALETGNTADARTNFEQLYNKQTLASEKAYSAETLANIYYLSNDFANAEKWAKLSAEQYGVAGNKGAVQRMTDFAASLKSAASVEQKSTQSEQKSAKEGADSAL